MDDRNAKMELKKQIASVHMMVEDLHLYLNTHPTDKVALSQHNAYVKQLKDLMDEYNRCFGMISEDGSTSQYPWQWIEEPWPWEYEANFRL